MKLKELSAYVIDVHFVNRSKHSVSLWGSLNP